MKLYLKLKPVLWGFSWWFRCASSAGNLYKFDLYLGIKKILKKEKEQLKFFLKKQNKVTVQFTFSIAQCFMINYLINASMELRQYEVGGNRFHKGKMINK